MSAHPLVFGTVEPTPDAASGAQPPLGALAAAFDGFDAALTTLHPLLPPRAAERLADLRAEAAEFRPRVCLIGQVKAGKTALANALIGAPGLLPSDVNPWTSVVTSVHLNDPPASGQRANFRFFDEETWQALLDQGGRLSAAAGREGADEDTALLSEQVADLRARAEARLGRNFHLLLGRSHSFSVADPELVRRYVCLGDEEDGPSEGRFADLTCAADLHVDAPGWGGAVTIDDTPGVNDPFLVREEMTLSSLGRASLCVLVLSAYQALSTTDLGLLRLVRTMRSGELVVFVNRIDELGDLGSELPRIDASLRAILGRAGVEDGRILYGSARWADIAESGDLSALTSGDWALLKRAPRDPAALSVAEAHAIRTELRALAGIEPLRAGIGEMLAEGPGRALLDRLAAQAGDLAAQASLALAELRAAPGIDAAAIAERLDLLLASLESDLTTIETRAVDDIERLQSSVVMPWAETAVATAARRGGEAVDTDALRGTLHRAYRDITARAFDESEAAAIEATAALRAVFADILGDGPKPFAVRDADLPGFGRPVALARSVSVDLAGSWRDRLWSRWRNDPMRAKALRETVETEFRRMLEETAAGTLRDGFASVGSAMRALLEPVIDVLFALTEGGGPDYDALVGTRAAEARARLDAAVSELGAFRAAATAHASARTA